MSDTELSDMDLSAAADAVGRAAAAFQQIAPLAEAVGDLVVDQGNRWSRARFNYPGRVADTDPFPVRAGDVE